MSPTLLNGEKRHLLYKESAVFYIPQPLVMHELYYQKYTSLTYMLNIKCMLVRLHRSLPVLDV
jgi:hypothetical protein